VLHYGMEKNPLCVVGGGKVGNKRGENTIGFTETTKVRGEHKERDTDVV